MQRGRSLGVGKLRPAHCAKIRVKRAKGICSQPGLPNFPEFKTYRNNKCESLRRYSNAVSSLIY